jgi:hypothetical protein
MFSLDQVNPNTRAVWRKLAELSDDTVGAR